MFKALPILLLLAVVHSVPTETTSDRTQDSTSVPPANPSSQTTDDDLPCALPDGQNGKCIPYYLCNANDNTVIADGVGLIDITERDGPCESYIDTCCPLTKQIEKALHQPAAGARTQV